MAHFTREEFLCIFTPLPPKTADFRYFWVWFSCFWCTKHKPDALPSVLYFCIFVNAKRKGVQIYLIKSTNESFIDYYIYYRHAHLFSQKHKNAKIQNCGVLAEHDTFDGDHQKNFFTPPTGAWQGKNYGMAWQKNFPRHAKKQDIHHQTTCSNKILQIS